MSLTDKQRIKLLEREAKCLHEALQFYANPGTYFATRVIVDPPCGDFCNDYSKITREQGSKFGWECYRGDKDNYYGKTARKAIEKAWNMWEKATRKEPQ